MRLTRWVRWTLRRMRRSDPRFDGLEDARVLTFVARRTINRRIAQRFRAQRTTTPRA